MVVPAPRGCAVQLCLFFIIDVLDVLPGFPWFFRYFWPEWLVQVAAVMIPPAAMTSGVIAAAGSPLPGTGLALRVPVLLPGLPWRDLRWFITLILWLRVFFCHICQTD